MRPLLGQATPFEIMFDHSLSLFLQREGYRPLKYLEIPSSSPNRHCCKAPENPESSITLITDTASDEQKHRFQPGHLVWIHGLPSRALELSWKGLYPVILTTPMVIKVAGTEVWSHHSYFKVTMTSQTKVTNRELKGDHWIPLKVPSVGISESD